MKWLIPQIKEYFSISVNLPAWNRFRRTLFAVKCDASYLVKNRTRYILLYTTAVPLDTQKNQIISDD
jgi:hypothetical protein